MARRANRQQELAFPSWGGKRVGAGRLRKVGSLQRHVGREPHASRHPVHVTLRVREGFPHLRGDAAFEVIDAALRAMRERSGFRIVHFSVVTNHVHLLVEASDADALRRGVSAFSIRVALGVNRIFGRRGPVWRDRYHARTLRTPAEVRRALCYVLQNLRRHLAQDGQTLTPTAIDARSSGPWFDGWRGVQAPWRDREAPVSPPRTWLLAEGWRRHGLIAVDEIPGSGRGRARARGRSEARRGPHPTSRALAPNSRSPARDADPARPAVAPSPVGRRASATKRTNCRPIQGWTGAAPHVQELFRISTHEQPAGVPRTRSPPRLASCEPIRAAPVPAHGTGSRSPRFVSSQFGSARPACTVFDTRHRFAAAAPS
jgi:putative transposase